MAVLWTTLLFSLLLAYSNCQVAKPTSVDSRFFGLGGLGGFINNLFPGLNLGNQGGSDGNPSGMDFPTNSQFYPNTPVQSPNSPVSSGQGSTWPVIDDASQFPNKGGNVAQQPQYPSQWNTGGSQYPAQGNMWEYPSYTQGTYPQYPNQVGFPNQMQQYPNQQDPNQSNLGGTQTQNPSYPVNNDGNQYQFPNQGENWNQNPSNPGTGQEDGTLDSIVPPTGSQNPSITELPSENTNNGNPILGKPVQVPPDNTDPGQIIFPNSTDTAATKKQCVQDCQTTSEYNPVCGSDNITYINPGKFVCARNCGNNVFVAHKGRCSQDAASSFNT